MAPPVHYHVGGFPPTNLEWVRLIPLIGRAREALARYDSLLVAIPNASVLLSPLMTQEAVLSSKIEGTHVTMGEVLEVEAGRDPADLTQPKRDDVEEILNYRIALTFCAKELEERPLSQHLLRQAHALLMQGVRGKDKTPGSFRKDQNWIGPPGCRIEDAGFVPIAPGGPLEGGMDAWSDYLGGTSEPDPIVQLSIGHVEFEALHPFRDGNGRLGRMLIPLFLFSRGLLRSPNFYMSGYLEERRDIYLERLRAVSRDGAWTDWVEFFLTGVIEQAAENERKAQAILRLYDRARKHVVELTHSQHALRAVEFIFQHPIFAATHFIASSEIPKPTASRILAALRSGGLIRTVQEAKGRRPGIYAFLDLLNVAEGRPVL